MISLIWDPTRAAFLRRRKQKRNVNLSKLGRIDEDLCVTESCARNGRDTYIGRVVKRLLCHSVALLSLAATNLDSRCFAADEVWENLPAPLPLPDPLRSGYVPVNGIQLYYAIYGKGEPLILLHGGMGNIEQFGNQIGAFAREFGVIALDSRGQGRSTRSSQALSYGLMASDVVGVMDFLNISKASVLGWSDGGIVGLDIAIHYPERLDKLVVFGANYNRTGLRRDGGKHRIFSQYFGIAERDYKRLSKTPDQYQEAFLALEKMWETQPNYSAQQLASIKAPTLVLDGEYDEIIKRSHTEEMATLIPNAKLKFIPEASHFAMFQRPADFNKAVLDFLSDRASIQGSTFDSAPAFAR